MMNEPRFAQPIPNVTVAVGRDANLPCVVEHLGGYKVSGDGYSVLLCCQKRKNCIEIEQMAELNKANGC